MDRLPPSDDRFDVFGPEPDEWLEIVRALEEGKAFVPSAVPAKTKQAHWRERAESVGVAFVDRRRRAEELLAPFSAFQVLALINLANARRNTAAAGSVLHRLPAVPEYVALLLAARSSSAPTLDAAFASEDEESRALHAALREVTRWIEDVIGAAPVALVERPPWQGQGALREIREDLLRWTLIYEAKETDSQANRVTTAIFEDPRVVTHLRRVAGFDVGDALRIIDTLGALSSRRLRLILQDRSAGGTGVRVAVRTRVTVDELVRASGVRRNVVERFVERFGLRFGAPPPEFPNLPTEAHRRPLLVERGWMMPIGIPSLRRFLRHSLVALLNPHPATEGAGEGNRAAFTALADRRGKWLEEQATAALQRALKPHWCERGVHFETAGERKQCGEIDLLFRLDRSLFVVEAKAGNTRAEVVDPTPEGFVQRLRKDLLASDQHASSSAALHSPGTRFYVRSADGDRPLAVPLRGVRRVVHVTVTLDDLSPVAADLGQAGDAGLLGDPITWVVSLAHLETVLELTAEVLSEEARYAVPAVFVHYLLARVATDLERVAVVQDEIDWLGEYLAEELAIRRTFSPEIARQSLKRADVDRARLPLTHRQVDAYVTARDAGWPLPDRPQPAHLTPGLLRLLRDLARWRPDEWLEVSLAILELPTGPRDRLGAAYVALPRDQRNPHHEQHECGKDGQGVVRGYGLHVLDSVPHGSAAHAAAVHLAEKARVASAAEYWFVLVVPRTGTIKELGCALAMRI